MTGHFETEVQIKRFCPCALILYKQVEGLSAFQQNVAKTTYTTTAEPFAAIFGSDINALDVTRLLRVRDDVGLENELSIVHQDPYAILLNALEIALAETCRIFL